MRHFERYIEHQGFAVSFWIDMTERRGVQEWYPGWVPEVMGILTSLIEYGAAVQEYLVNPIITSVNEMAEGIIKILQPFLR